MRSDVVRRIAGPSEILVGVIDAGVDDRDLDPFAAQAETLPYAGRTNERHAVRVVRFQQLKRVHGNHVRKRDERADLVTRDPHLDTVVGRLVIRKDMATKARDVGAQRILRPLELHLDMVLFVLVQFPAGIGLLDGDGVAGQLNDDSDILSANAERQDSWRDQLAGMRRGNGPRGASICGSGNSSDQDNRGERASRENTHGGSPPWYLRCRLFSELGVSSTFRRPDNRRDRSGG